MLRMPQFAYIALTASGERVAGVLAGASQGAVLAELESRRLVPVEVVARPERSGRGRGVSSRRLAEAYGQLSDLLGAGVPLLRSLRLLGNRKSVPTLSACFRDLADGVSQGRELGEAMADHPHLFPGVHVAMVRAGEKGGFLEAVLRRLAQLVSAQADLRAKVIGSMVYPMVLLGVGAVVLMVLLVFFVPMLRPLAAQAGDLPLVSRVLFWLSDVLVGRWYVVLVALAGAAAGVVWCWRLPAVRARVDRWLTVMPVVGPLTRTVATARFCRLLGTMLGNGIPLLSAMGVARAAAGNALLEGAIDRATEAVRGGQPLSGPLGESGLLGEDVVEMIAVGEQANNLDEVLVSIAETQERRIDRLLTAATRLIEPLLLVVIAVVVGLVFAGLLLPMMQLRGGG